jgi:hypothetical protein
MVLFRIRLVLTARTKPLPASLALLCRCPLTPRRAQSTSRRQSRCVRRRIDEWRATLYDAPFESGPESAHIAFAAISRKFAALDRHPAREASSLGFESRSSQHGSRGSETNSRLPCARSIPSDTAPSCGCNRRFSQPPTREARALRAALLPATCAQAIPIRHLLTLLRIVRQSRDRHR